MHEYLTVAILPARRVEVKDCVSTSGHVEAVAPDPDVLDAREDLIRLQGIVESRN
jgi:hypothetical protein